MSWVITGSQPFPAVIGEEFGGGFFAGYISHTADGNPTHALIVAPRATGMASGLSWKTNSTVTTGTTSSFDGAANTAAMVTAGIANHPAASFCVNLSIGGFTDWYLPARYELDIAYFNLKPTTAANATSWDGGSSNNVYSVPRRSLNATATYPTQTPLTAFNTSAQAFLADYFWSSSENGTNAWGISFGSGQQLSGFGKSGALRVRAFRRIAL